MINKSYSSLNDREAMQGVASLGRGISFSSLIFQAFHFVVGVAALPLRLLLRDDLGERTVRPGAFLLSVALHIYYFTIFDLLIALGATSAITNPSNEDIAILVIVALSNPYFIFLVIVIRRGIKHFKQKIRAARSNQTGYSYAAGKSRYFEKWIGRTVYGFDVNDSIIRLIIEPRAILKWGILTFLACLGIVLWMVFLLDSEASYIYIFIISLGCTGLVAAFDAICLFIDELALQLRKRDKVLDMLDAQDDANELMQYRAKIEEGRTTAGNNQQEADSADLEDDIIVVNEKPITQNVSLMDGEEETLRQKLRNQFLQND